MCGQPPGANWFISFIDSMLCYSPLTAMLNDDQLKTAKSFASQLEEK